MDEKIYNGALALLGILVALFTFALYLSEQANDANESVRNVFVFLTGALVIACALSGLISCTQLAKTDARPVTLPQTLSYWLFCSTLVTIGLIPIFLWIAAKWYHFF